MEVYTQSKKNPILNCIARGKYLLLTAPDVPTTYPVKGYTSNTVVQDT